MKYFLLIVVLMCMHISVKAEEDCTAQKRVVCYYSSWAIYRPGDGQFDVSQIDPSLCTHLVYSFAGLDINSKITSLDYNFDINVGNYLNFTNLKTDNPCLKVLLAIGGWNEGSIKYSVMSSTEESRNAFVESALRYLVHYGFDGLDLDWEYPTERGGIGEDSTNFELLLKRLYERLSKWNLLLTIAIPMQLDGFDNAYTNAALQIPDYVSIMAYDFTPTNSEITGLLAPLPKIEESINKLLSKGVPSNKIVLGLPTYARTFTLADPKDYGVGAPTVGPGSPGKFTQEAGFLSYYEVQLKLQNTRYTKECSNTDQNCYAYYKTDWLSFDDIDTYRKKTKLAIDKQLGGVMVWTLDTDDFSGQFGDPFTVLNAIRAEYENNNVKFIN